GSAGTDLLIGLIKKTGPRNGLYGARVTGGGSGGTVAVLGRPSGEAAVLDVADQYGEMAGYKPHIFRSSSLGAAGFVQLGWVEGCRLKVERSRLKVLARAVGIRRRIGRDLWRY